MYKKLRYRICRKRVALIVIHNEKEMLDMRRFNVPHMTMVSLAKEDIIITSTCSENFCFGHECDECWSKDWSCEVVTPCTVHQCGKVLCPTYSS